MMFAKKKVDAIAPEHVKDLKNSDSDEMRSITESLYKQNLELAVKNKTLSILGKLYEISIQTLSTKELSQKVAEIVQKDFDFERVGLLSYEQGTDSIKILGFAESERFSTARSMANSFFDEMVIESASTHSLFGTVLKKKEMGYTEDLAQMWGIALKPEEIQKIQTDGHVKSILVYPLIIQDQIIGFFVLTLNRVYYDLVDYEKDSIRSFVNVISVAIDKARLYEELQTANKQQIVLIHFITHQIKGFVTKSRNIFSMILEGDLGVVPEEMRPMVEEGFRSDTQGAQTIQEILNASNVKSGAVTYNMQPFDFSQLVKETADALKPNADKKSLALTLNIEDNLSIVGDRMQLQNAVKNMIDNAIKYTPSGSVTVSLTKEGDTVRFVEQDTGVGISPEDMAHMFTEGGHGKESIKVNVESTGFGLYIVKNIVEAHHGKVWAESEGVGKGSKFVIELPSS